MRELIDYILQQVTQMLAERGFVGTKLTGGAIRGEVPVTSIPTHPHDASAGTKGQIAHSTLSGITASDHHAEVSLAASADVLLGLSGQALSLDTQTANRVLAGPTSGAADAPTFRALVAADVPGGSGMATDPLWDAAGDLAVGTGADTAAKLAKGADGTLLGVVAGAVGWVATPTHYVPLATMLVSMDWNTTAHSTDATPQALNLASVFGVPANVKAVLARVQVNDSASATNASLIEFGPNATYYYQSVVSTSGIANDRTVSATIIINTDGNSGVYYKCAASGTLTLDVWMEITGYWL